MSAPTPSLPHCLTNQEHTPILFDDEVVVKINGNGPPTPPFPPDPIVARRPPSPLPTSSSAPPTTLVASSKPSTTPLTTTSFALTSPCRRSSNAGLPLPTRNWAQMTRSSLAPSLDDASSFDDPKHKPLAQSHFVAQRLDKVEPSGRRQRRGVAREEVGVAEQTKKRAMMVSATSSAREASTWRRQRLKSATRAVGSVEPR